MCTVYLHYMDRPHFILASVPAVEKLTEASDVSSKTSFYTLSSLIVGNTQSATKFRNEDSELWNKGLICLNHYLLWNGKSMAFDESVLQCDNVKCEIGCLKRLLSLLFRNSIPFNVWEVFHLLWRACLSRKLVSWNFEQRRKKPRKIFFHSLLELSFAQEACLM